MTTRKLTAEQEQECHRADQIIRDIDTLAGIPEFRRFMERQAREANKMAEQVLNNDDLTGRERRDLRLKRKGILSVLDSPAADRKGSVSVLKSHGRPVPVYHADDPG